MLPNSVPEALKYKVGYQIYCIFREQAYQRDVCETQIHAPGIMKVSIIKAK